MALIIFYFDFDFETREETSIGRKGYGVNYILCSPTCILFFEGGPTNPFNKRNNISDAYPRCILVLNELKSYWKEFFVLAMTNIV
jgi:hypothetical protein